MYVSGSSGFAMPIGKTSDKKTKMRVHCKKCPRCGEDLKTVFVHGHEQCVTCDQVIHDCCQGECA